MRSARTERQYTDRRRLRWRDIGLGGGRRAIKDNGTRGRLGRPEPLRFLTDDDGRKIGERIFKHGGEGLGEMAACLMTASGVLERSNLGRDRNPAQSA